jgi:hypothetical protein
MEKTLEQIAEERTKNLQEMYRKATGNILENVRIYDGIKETKPAYEINTPSINICGVLEIVGLFYPLENILNMDLPEESSEWEFPYALSRGIKTEDNQRKRIPTFDKTEFIPDLFPELTTEERVGILEKADPVLLYHAARNLRYYHEMNLTNKGIGRGFQLNGWDSLSNNLLSTDLKKKILTSLPNCRGTVESPYIELPENKEEGREFERLFPPLYFEAIKEIAGLIRTGYQTERSKE